MSDTETGPSKEAVTEREREDRERKEKEQAEQAALPYKWTQTIKDADVTIPVAANIRGRDLRVELNKTKIFVGIKGGETFIDVWTTWITLMFIICAHSHVLFFSDFCIEIGYIPTPHPRRRIDLDPRVHFPTTRQRNCYPP